MILYPRRAGILPGLLAAFLVGVPNVQAQRPLGPPPEEPTFPYDPGEPPPVPLDDPRMQPPPSPDDASTFPPPPPDARGTSPPAPQGDSAVQPRGPVHEAFARPFAPNPAPGSVVPRRPPDPIPEMPPDQRPEGNGVTWTPGYWAWDAERNDFLWVSGVWRAAPPGRKWVPGYWVPADGGYRWVPGFWAPDGPEDMPYLPPPPASLDTGPNGPPPDGDSLWAPGCWVYHRQRYVWRPGYWLACRPNLLWTPPCYTWTPAGYLFVDGYWDAPLAGRGLLFAPVHFSQPLGQTPGWAFQPSYCIDPGALLASLFVGPSYGNYYFGDYYGPSYRQQGFLPWFTSGRGYYNPLFNYYAWQNQGNPGWHRRLYNTFQGRYAGTLPRPPRTLIAPNRLGPNGGSVRLRRSAAVHALQVVRPLAQMRNSGVRLVRRLAPPPRPQGTVPHAASPGPFPTGPGPRRQAAPVSPQPALRPAPAQHLGAAPRPAPPHSQPAPAFHAAGRSAPPAHANHPSTPPTPRPAPAFHAASRPGPSSAPRPAPAPHTNHRSAPPPAPPAHASSNHGGHSGHH